MSGPLEVPGTADELRASTDAMRDAVHTVATTGSEVWTGPFTTLVEAFEQLGRVDLALARLVEGHADAVRILDQADRRPRAGAYGVWASRSAGTGVHAEERGDRWHLTGECRFASGIDIVDRVLLPGWLDPDRHLLFDVPVDHDAADRSTWRTAAMDASRSFTTQVDLDADAGDVVGPPGFYLGRRGFPIGGLGVAAVWAGGARGVLDQVVGGLRRFRPTAHQLRRVGAIEQAVWQAETAVRAVAERLPDLDGDALWRETTAARTATVTACEQVLDEAGRIVGPGGLSSDARLARTLADLAIYVRQHHLDLALEAAGRHALEPGDEAR